MTVLKAEGSRETEFAHLQDGLFLPPASEVGVRQRKSLPLESVLDSQAMGTNIRYNCVRTAQTKCARCSNGGRGG